MQRVRFVRSTSGYPMPLKLLFRASLSAFDKRAPSARSVRQLKKAYSRPGPDEGLTKDERRETGTTDEQYDPV